MKILVAQFYTQNIPYGQYSKKINQKYCEEKGYQYYCEKDNDKIIKALNGRSPTWYKPTLVNELLNTFNPDYILFLDIDAVVSDFNQNIEDFIDNKYDLIFTKDFSHHSAVNAGIFIIKNNKWSKNFLKTWENSADIYTPEHSRDLIINKENEGVVGYFNNALWHDQTFITI